MSELVIKTLGQDKTEQQKWDAFVDQCQLGTFFHLSGWKTVIEKSYGHTCHFLYANQDERIVGVLPLAHQKSILFGNALISLPFCVYGGAASDDPDVMNALEDAAIELAQKLGVDYLEMRYPFGRQNRLSERCAHSTFGCDLGDDDAAILAGVKKNERAVIRHSLNNGLEYTVSGDVKECYEIYSESVRNLGTPVFPKHYFSTLKDVFGERCEVLTVTKEGKSVSSVLSFYYKNEVLPYYGGGTPQARELKSNDFMYYQLMCHARNDRACHRYDFGRSKNDSGAFKYKKNWGMAPVPLHYQFYLVKAEALPNLSPNNPKYQLFIQMWKRLPIWLSRLMGPFLSKYLG
ncbi:FemAB family XrtA/PEP-CTERM system-associated protein [Bowmanella sp. JS7-9]|uniref:FemAB family XrtA/PEP-CTERM system-associated protein n=1 Tax=Pseudobowmanella zhangzhouensis TaxID=1537679 RepID=A0ABW1XHR4_9ALTE|nr:FemAB family XrtA/PEP-CTERM system-associated protein [Bowmanella sp. JS7-9]